jgi:hypothetical protein
VPPCAPPPRSRRRTIAIDAIARSQFDTRDVRAAGPAHGCKQGDGQIMNMRYRELMQPMQSGCKGFRQAHSDVARGGAGPWRGGFETSPRTPYNRREVIESRRDPVGCRPPPPWLNQGRTLVLSLICGADSTAAGSARVIVFAEHKRGRSLQTQRSQQVSASRAWQCGQFGASLFSWLYELEASHR